MRTSALRSRGSYSHHPTLLGAIAAPCALGQIGFFATPQYLIVLWL